MHCRTFVVRIPFGEAGSMGLVSRALLRRQQFATTGEKKLSIVLLIFATDENQNRGPCRRRRIFVFRRSKTLYREYLDLCRWKRKVSVKSLNSEDARQNCSGTALPYVSTILQTESFKLWENLENSILGSM